MRFWISLLLALVTLVPRSAAESEEFKKERETQRVALVTRLIALANWCQGVQLFAERDITYRRVLTIDPENMDARKGLRYAHNGDGTWKEPASRSVLNLNKKALEEIPARRTAALTPYGDALLAALAKEKEDPELTRAVYDELLALDPDDVRVRTKRGEVKEGADWLLAETVRGKTRRAEIRTLVKAALESPMDIKPTSATSTEAAWADNWGCGSETPAVRVLSATGANDCDALLRILQATTVVVGDLFEIEVKLPPEFNFYVIPPAARTAFLDRYPGLGDDLKKLLMAAPGGGLSGGHSTVLFEADVRKRNDCAVRNALSHLLRGNFGIDVQQGWAWEGLGLYLTRELVGTRLTWYVLAQPTAESLRKSLLVPESNWMNEGLKVLNAAEAPKLTTVLEKPIATLGVQEVLIGYVFSAYLLEGWPDKTADFVRRIGAGGKPDEVSRAVLGLSMDDVQEHLLRWLKERK